jgi:hypothetical protein
MQTALYIVKYAFVIGLGVEIILILRSLFQLARDKARAATVTPATAEE